MSKLFSETVFHRQIQDNIALEKSLPSGRDLFSTLPQEGEGPKKMRKRIPSETRVVVLMGGWSCERDISLESGRACVWALKENGFQVIEIDPQKYIAETLDALRPDVVFNALHGPWGEDGTVQAICETLKIPYTHSGLLASALAMHKPRAKLFFREAGIPTVEHRIVSIESLKNGHPIPPPYVIKPFNQGSSVGVKIVRPQGNLSLDQIAQDVSGYGTHVMVERYIPGRELTCAVMGDVALRVTEIAPTMGFYDYDSKYTEGKSTHVLPADLPPDVSLKIQKYALMAHEALGCKGITRSDFRYDENSELGGDVFILELNTQPGMTKTSLVPELALDAGHTFHDLVTWMVNDASLDR